MAGEAGYAHTPENRHYNYQFRATAIAFIVLLSVFAFVRLLAKILPRGTRWGWDDFWLLPAFVTNIGQNVTAIICANYLGDYLRRDPDDPQTIVDAENFLIAIWVLQYLYALALTTPKLSVLALYLRLCKDRATRICTWLTIFFVAGTGIAYFLTTLLICLPIPTFWNGQQGTCLNEQALHQSVSALSVAADIAILILPMKTISSIKATPARKLGIMLTVMMGSIGLAAGIARWVLWFTIEILSTELRGPLLLDMWSFVETGIYFFAACMPAMRGLFSNGRDAFRSLSGGRSDSSRSPPTDPESNASGAEKDPSRGADEIDFATFVAREGQLTRTRRENPSRMTA